MTFPDLETLTATLTSLLSCDDSPDGRLTIIDRRSTPHATTFPIEIVTCRLGDGSERQLFCKHAAGKDSSAYQHRGGVAYEALVYRDVLEPLRRLLWWPRLAPVAHDAHRCRLASSVATSCGVGSGSPGPR